MKISVEHKDFPTVPGCVRSDLVTYYFAQDDKDGKTINFTYITKYDMKGYFSLTSLQNYNLIGRVKSEFEAMANSLYKIENS